MSVSGVECNFCSMLADWDIKLGVTDSWREAYRNYTEKYHGDEDREPLVIPEPKKEEETYECF